MEIFLSCGILYSTGLMSGYDEFHLPYTLMDIRLQLRDELSIEEIKC